MMKYTQVITTILDRTSKSYAMLDKMEDHFGVNSPEANEARSAWHELYKLCKAIGLEWEP